MRENLKYLVVGDTIIDENVYLIANGLSLESPTIKTTFDKKSINYGGAANVAKFLSSFGRNVTFLTSLSEEHAENYEVENNVLVKEMYQGKDNYKTRYWITHGDSTYKYLQVNNVNEEYSYSPLSDYDISQYDIIAFADYRCGFITEKFISKCVNSGKIIYASSQVSSRASNYERYSGVDYIVCNREESNYVNRDTNVCVTKGSNGCTMNGIDYPAYPVESVVNTIGAGDCFYAALLATGDPKFANESASKFVSTSLYE